MTEAEALDEAAKAAGWRDWKTLQLIARPDKQDDIRRHARTLMENAALKAENERLREALELCLGELYAPEEACSCHISPPCGDCVEYSSIRNAITIARAALKEIEGD